MQPCHQDRHQQTATDAPGTFRTSVTVAQKKAIYMVEHALKTLAWPQSAVFSYLQGN